MAAIFMLTLGGAGVIAQPAGAQGLGEKKGRIMNEIRRAEEAGTAYDRVDTSVSGLSGGASGARPESIVGLTLRITLFLIVIAVLLFAAAWLLRRLGLAGSSRPGGGAMEVLEGLPLGQNRTLVLARVADKVYLIGLTPQQMLHVETFEGEKALEVISNTRGGVSITKFKDVFNSFMGKGAKPS